MLSHSHGFNREVQVAITVPFVLLSPRGLHFSQAASFGELLGCEMNALGGIIDPFGRTTVPGVYAAGDAAVVMPAQLIIAAAEGSRTAAGVNMVSATENSSTLPHLPTCETK